MQRITRYIFVIILLITALLSVSCSTVDKVEPVKNRMDVEDSIRLRFISSWGGVDSKAGTLQSMLNKFVEENPHIEVVNESLFGEDFLPKLKTDFASGNDPDVFGLWPGSDIKALINAGKVADLTDLISGDTDWKNDFKNMWEYTTFNGRTYGLPVEVIFEGLFVNTDLFEKYNVKIPQSFDELKLAVHAFKHNNIIPIAYNTLAEGTFLYQNLIAVIGQKHEVENPFTNNRVNNCFIEAMNIMKALYEMGAFPPNYLSLTNNERNALFRDKKAAMIAQGSWFIGDFDEEAEVDIVPFPCVYKNGLPSAALIYGLGCGVFHLSSAVWNDIDKKDTSIILLKYLTSKDFAATLAKQTGMISNIDISNYNIKYSRLTNKGISLINNARILVGPPDSFVDRTFWEEVIAEKFPYVLEGRKTPEELWEEAVREGMNSQIRDWK